jgi:hypothetical protein
MKVTFHLPASHTAVEPRLGALAGLEEPGTWRLDDGCERGLAAALSSNRVVSLALRARPEAAQTIDQGELL